MIRTKVTDKLSAGHSSPFERVGLFGRFGRSRLGLFGGSGSGGLVVHGHGLQPAKTNSTGSVTGLTSPCLKKISPNILTLSKLLEIIAAVDLKELSMDEVLPNRLYKS